MLLTGFPPKLVPLVLVVVAIILIFIFIAKMATLYDMKRKETLETTAREMGLEYGEAAFIDKVCFEAGFPLFLEKRGQTTNCMFGKYEDAGIAIFNHQYARYQLLAERDKVYRHTAVLFSSEDKSFPEINIRPRTIFPTLKPHLSISQAIDLKSHKDFAKKYVVSGSDKTQIRYYLRDEVLNYLSLLPKFFVEARRNKLIVYKTGKVSFKYLLEQAKIIYNLL